MPTERLPDLLDEPDADDVPDGSECNGLSEGLPVAAFPGLGAEVVE